MMESSVIISSVDEIYERFNIMPALQMHMRRVAAVAALILSIDCYAKTNKDDVIAALLLHDIGNIVKFRLGEEDASWRKIQQEAIAKYGLNDHKATEKMIHELGVNNRVALLISEMGFENLLNVIDSTDMEQKICLYADQRVAPHGVVSLQARFADLQNRYKDTPLKSRFDPEQEKRALLLEQQIFTNTSLQPSEINDQTIARFLDISS